MKPIKIWQLLFLVPVLVLAACDSDDTVTPDPEPQVTDLMINEFMASNDSWDVDGSGNNPDWIELYNTTAVDIDIAGYYMTDKTSDDVASWYQIPTGSAETVVPANGWLVLFADKEPGDGVLHLDFSLKSSGESIGLADANETVIVAFDYEQQATDVSMGLSPDGSATAMVFLATATPGVANSAASGNLPPVISEIILDPAVPGPMEDILVTVEAFDDSGLTGADLYYRIQGEEDFVQEEMTSTGKATGTYVYDSINGQVAGTVIEYYVLVTDSDSEQTASPEDAPSSFHTFTVAATVDSPLFINEFMAKNDSWDVDGTGDFPDWIEIYNSGDEDIDLAGWYLTDSPLADLSLWSHIPTGDDSSVVPAGGFLVLFANEGDSAVNTLNLNFKLSGGGDSIALANAAGNLASSMSFNGQTTDISSGLTPDGEGDYVVLATPTPGAANSAASSGK